MTAPPFAYYGGKTTLAQRIVQHLPSHQHYVEPFAGSLAVLLAKAPSRMETVNDLDQDLMTFWRVLRDQPDDLRALCAMTPHSRAEHIRCQDDLYRPTTDLERARQVWVLLTQTRSSTLRRTGWRHFQNPDKTSAGMPRYLAGYVDRMPPAAERLRDVTLECRPALDVITDYGRHSHVLLYVDPPYLASTRNGSNYRHEMPSAPEHEDLARALHLARATVVLSGYPSALYQDLYADWTRIELDAWTGNANAGTGDRVEVLWMNRDRAADLFSEVGA